MRQVRVAIFFAAERDEKAVGETVGQALDTDIRAPLEILDDIDIAWQGAECVLDFTHFFLRRPLFELKQDDVAQELLFSHFVALSLLLSEGFRSQDRIRPSQIT